MNIVYVSDNNFADITGVSIVSLFENNKDEDEINIFIIDDGIQESNKEKLISLADSYNRCLKMIPIPDMRNLLNTENISTDNWPLNVFARLFLALIIPDDIEKTFYMDGDVMIRGSLKALYSENIDDYYAAGTLSFATKEHRKNLGLNEHNNYFSSGMLLFNIKKCREDNICLRFTDFISSNGKKLWYPEQDALNGTIGSSMKVISPVYNSLAVYFVMSYKAMFKYFRPCKYHTEHEYSQAVKNPVIIHFHGNVLTLRPWIDGSEHPHTFEWLEYKSISPWAGEPLKKDYRSGKTKFLIRIYKLLPRFISESIIGLLSYNNLKWTKS